MGNVGVTELLVLGMGALAFVAVPLTLLLVVSRLRTPSLAASRGLPGLRRPL